MNHTNEYLKVTVTQCGCTSEAASLRRGHKEGKDHFIFPVRTSLKPQVSNELRGLKSGVHVPQRLQEVMNCRTRTAVRTPTCTHAYLSHSFA